MKSMLPRIVLHRLTTYAVAASALVLGCETLDEEGPGNVLQISPSNVSRKLDQSVVLTAQGGANYRWSVADASYGSLSATVGESVIYTVRKVPPAGAEFTQTITLTGTTDLDTTGNATAIASVRHVAASEEPTTLVVTGGDVAIVGGSPVTLSVTGGDGKNYSWSLGKGGVGSLSATTGNKVAYRATADATAAQTIRVTSGKQTKSHILAHQSGETALAITGPTAATVGGTAISLSVNGGDGVNYVWSLSKGGVGTLSETTGKKVTYRATGNPDATQTIRVTSGSKSDTHVVLHQSAITPVTIASSSREAVVGGKPITLTASGGDGASYSWTIANAAIGYLSGTSGRQVTYRATDTVNATQTIRVSSARKTYQIAVVHVP